MIAILVRRRPHRTEIDTRLGRANPAHQAVLHWCAAQRREITGERWEVYGDWHEDPAQLQTMVFYRLH